ncbi:MAG: prepilin-type N-terminal cleavage/methylation domain-containing protein, partial [Phycisphaerales bacterium]
MTTARATSRARPRGFTLVELIVASVVGAMVAGATVMSMSQLLSMKARAVGRQQAYGRAEAAAATVARDLVNAIRDSDLAHARVAVMDSGDAEQPQDQLLLLARSARRARPGGEDPEGGAYEVHLRIAPLASRPETSALWRRIDPALDIAIDGGGVASAVVSGVVSMQAEATDGEAWFEAWDSDLDGMPHAVRVTITASSDDGRVTAVARRTVAIDRVPIPPEPPDESAPTGATGPTGDPAAPAGGGTPTGGSPAPSPGPVPGGGSGGGPRGGGGGGPHRWSSKISDPK